jgi:hypothetical protein
MWKIWLKDAEKFKTIYQLFGQLDLVNGSKSSADREDPFVKIFVWQRIHMACAVAGGGLRNQ